MQTAVRGMIQFIVAYNKAKDVESLQIQTIFSAQDIDH